MLFISAVSWYFYQGYRKETSFILRFPRDAKTAEIEKDLILLKKKSYRFLSLAQLQKDLKKGFFPSKAVAIIIEQAPTARLQAFLKSRKIPAAFFISADQAAMAKKYKKLTFGLKLTFPKPKQHFIQSGYVSINFDDGWASVYQNGLPILRKASLPASAYIIPKTMVDGNDHYMTADQIRGLQSSGWEIGSHSFGHEHFEKLGQKATDRSLAVSKSYLQGLGLHIYGFAFPYDKFKADSLIIAKNYYGYYRLGTDNFNYSSTELIDSFAWKNGFSLNWIKSKLDEAKKKKLGVVFVFHEVSDNGRPYAIKISLFKKVVEAIKKAAYRSIRMKRFWRGSRFICGRNSVKVSRARAIMLKDSGSV